MSDKAVSLLDMIPEPTEKKMPSGKVLKLRKVNLNDNVWIDRKYGQKKLDDIFNKIEMVPICEICWHLCSNKQEWKAIQEVEEDENGEEQTVTVTGPQRIMREISSPQDKIDLFKMLLKTIGVSNPMVENIDKAIKKKPIRTPDPSWTGEKSSTQSAEPTEDTRTTA